MVRTASYIGGIQAPEERGGAVRSRQPRTLRGMSAQRRTRVCADIVTALGLRTGERERRPALHEEASSTVHPLGWRTHADSTATDIPLHGRESGSSTRAAGDTHRALTWTVPPPCPPCTPPRLTHTHVDSAATVSLHTPSAWASMHGQSGYQERASSQASRVERTPSRNTAFCLRGGQGGTGGGRHRDSRVPPLHPGTQLFACGEGRTE